MRETIDLLVGDALGATVTGSAPISERLSIVSRLTLDREPRTAIVKHTRGRMHPEFEEELLVSRFLRELSAEEGLKPRLYAWDAAAGVMLSEDLGPVNMPRPRTYGELNPLLASALARLHAATMDRHEQYLALRRASGIGEDRRRHGLAGERAHFARGVAWLTGRSSAAVARELAEVARLTEEPGRFLGLIHDDLANARQTFEVGGALHLLDFENAKYSHVLLDFVKLTIGKFELDLDTGAYVWSNPGFLFDILDHYRPLLPVRFDDDEWHRNVAAAHVRGALALVGRLTVLEPQRRLAGTVPQNINGILYRLLQLLHPRAELLHLRACLTERFSPLGLARQ